MSNSNEGASAYETELNEWIRDEKAAIELIHVLGELWFDKSIELVIFRNQLVDRSASEILQLHNYALNMVGKPITIQDTLLLSKEIIQTEIAPARIDIGRLATEWIKGMEIDKAEKITNKEIAEELSLPPVKIHCSVLAEEAIKAAIEDYKNKKNNEINESNNNNNNS